MTPSRILAALASRLGAIWTAFDVRDVFLCAGLAVLTYGLHLHRPWIAWTVCGALLMVLGYCMRGRG